MTGLLEILTTKLWMVSPDFVHASRSVIEHNLNTHTALAFREKKHPFLAVQRAADAAPDILEYQVTEDGKTKYSWELGSMESPFVNVLPVDGPITRNGAACSYGSVELRDWLIRAANDKMCRGHIFYIDTPGGSAWAKNDFQQAIDYVHSLNQPVLAFIDGMCASAGMYLASLCDEVYFMHPKNQLGCIGVMAAFYTEKDGSYNKYDNETYHEIYDPESFDKNRPFRDIANDGNDKLLVKELTDLGVEFRSDVKAAFPAATDDHIHGKIFNAEDVVGILCDGQASFGDTILRAFALYDGAARVVRTAPATPSSEDASTSDDDASKCKPKSVATDGGASTELSNSNPQNQMKDYNNIASACGVESLVIAEDGAHFVPAMLDQLETSLAASADARQAAEARVAELIQEAENATTAHQEAIANREQELNATHEQVLENLRNEHADALRTEQEARQAVEQQLHDAQEQLDTAQQTIADRDAQIESLTHSAAEQTDESPANNGMGVNPTEEGGMPAYDPNLSPMENKRILDEYKAKLYK